jgi:hypothetical protein
MPNGALAWPILLLLGLHFRLPRRWLLALAAGATLVIGSYWVDYPSLGGGLVTPLTERPLPILQRMATLFGAPWSWTSTLAGGLLGAAGILGALLLLGRLALRRPAVCEAEIVYLGLLAFGLGSGLLITLGRIWVPAASWNAANFGARYQTIVLLFWLCLIALATLRLSAPRPHGAARRALLMALVLLWSTLVVAPAALQRARHIFGNARAYRRANTAMLVGIRHLDSYSALLPVSALVAAHRDFLRQEELGVFSRRRQEFLGLRLRDQLPVTDPDACRGAVSSARFLDEASPGEVRVEGWAWDPERDRQPRLILIGDETGRVIGLGTPERRSLPWARLRDEAARWTAFARPLRPGDRIEAWALLARSSVCRIASAQPR